MIELPDVLVLGAGGSLGEAWMTGLLGGLGLDFRRCEYFVGTSAGAVVAATLAAGREPHVLAGTPGDELALVGLDEEVEGAGGAARRAAQLAGTLGRGARRLGVAAATPFAPAVLAAGKPAGRFARAAVLRAAKRPERTLPRLRAHVDELAAQFDGRLRVSAVDRASGARVMFGAPKAPRASVADAVVASCAVPWIFAPVEIDGREYVDGGVWSPTNLDAAPAGRGARVLCLMPTAGAPAPYRAGTLAAVGAEALALRARGANVRTIAPDAPTIEAFGPDLLDPRNRDAVAAAGFAQGRRLA